MKNTAQIRNIINGHKQIFPDSCVPMAIECILKLIELMPINDFSLQNDRYKSGHSDWIRDGFDYPYKDPKVKFFRQFKLGDIDLKDRGEHFMKDHFDALFNTIDSELKKEKYIFISLESGINCWHMHVIYNKNNDNTYQTLTFIYGQNDPVFETKDLRQIVAKMEGTDIITYKYL